MADEGFADMGTKDRERYETKYAKLASFDSVTVPDGLTNFLHSIDDWAMKPKLRAVKKIKCGNHRMYVAGRHTDCEYRVLFVMANKRKEDDKPESDAMQNKILRSLEQTDLRLIPIR